MRVLKSQVLALERVGHLGAARVQALAPVRPAPADGRVDGEERHPRERDAQRRVDLEAGQPLIADRLVVAGLAAQDRHVLAADAEVDRRLADLALAAAEIDARQAAAGGDVAGGAEGVEVVDAVHRAAQHVLAPRAADVAAEAARALGGAVDVLLIEPLGGAVREVVGVGPCAQPAAEVLRHAAVDAVAAPGLRGGAAVGRRRRLLVEHRRPQIAARARRQHVAVLAAELLAGLGEPVVRERRVLAAVDGPEERVGQRLPAQRRGAVGRDQEAGRAVVLLDRVVEDRQVHQGDALDLQQRVAQERVVVEVDDRAARHHLPPRRRLDAGAERAVDHLVLLRAELVNLLAAEHRFRFLRAEHAALGALAEQRLAEGVVEHARLQLGVELHPVGRDPARGRDEQHVAGRDDEVAVQEDLDVLSLELRLIAVEPHRDGVDAGQHRHTLGLAVAVAGDGL